MARWRGVTADAVATVDGCDPRAGAFGTAGAHGKLWQPFRGASTRPMLTPVLGRIAEKSYGSVDSRSVPVHAGVYAAVSSNKSMSQEPKPTLTGTALCAEFAAKRSAIAFENGGAR